MPRVPLVHIEEMNSHQRAQYDRFPSNLTRGLLLLNDRLAEALPNLANALRASSLDPKLREAVILRVAALHDSDYERMQHLAQARHTGWAEDEIAAIEAGANAVEEPELATLLRFVETVVAGPSVPNESFAALRKVLSPQDVATVIILIGHYMMIARFLGILEIPLDAHPASWEHEH